jgi:hypothetical protein
MRCLPMRCMPAHEMHAYDVPALNVPAHKQLVPVDGAQRASYSDIVDEEIETILRLLWHAQKKLIARYEMPKDAKWQLDTWPYYPP